jgi:hypothetical protein
MIDVFLYVISSERITIVDLSTTYKTMQVMEDHNRAKVCAIWELDPFPLTAHCFHDFFLDTNVLI